MLIVNADDWGRSASETNAALDCYVHGSITSVTAMVFMEDSERAAKLAGEAGIDVGLHLNLTQEFTGRNCQDALHEDLRRIRRFLKKGKHALLLYNPWLRREFRSVYRAQAEEFERLYGKRFSHVDGHQHMHLCANMVLDPVIPEGEKVRRNLSFWAGEKNWLNRTYRWLVDWRLARSYGLTHYFFDLSRCIEKNALKRVARLAKTANVELMSHPVRPNEYAFLLSDTYRNILREYPSGTYSMLKPQ